MNTTPDTARFEKEILLKAPQHRVWQALTDPRQFGEWFMARLDTPFAVGRPATGKLTVPGYEHLDLHLTVERLQPERLFSFRWHPYAVDPRVDYAVEAPTLVEFMLDDVQGNTLLTVAESGFDQLPQARRDEAYRMERRGWAQQLEHIQAYVKA
ncbi:MAG: hypothetical protein JWP29_2051 [Rhodoferax sp.]|nr:hypothetical protein [Rhodoferax sp.]